MAGDSALSLAETNKVRESLGLAPLAGEDDDDNVEAGSGSEEEDADTIAERNFAEKQAEAKKAREDKETKERLQKAKNQRELRAKLQGKGLGEDDGGADGGALAWIKQSRKRAKERAVELEKLKQREKDLNEQERQALYGEDDLAGLKVAHGIEDFEEGKDVVLTLADKKILDDDDDELQNVNLAEYARTANRLDLKKRGKNAYSYTGYDDEEFGGPSQPGRARGVLSKYDEVIGEDETARDGEGFRLGGGVQLGQSSKAVKIEDGTEQRELNRDLLSLDYSKTEANDYLQEGDVGFKKPKKKKKSKTSTRRAIFDDGDQPEASTSGQANGDVDMENGEEDESKPKLSTVEKRLAKENGGGDGAVIDDDDLQAALARQRRAANKKRIQALRGEDIAKQIIEERAGSMPVDDNENDVLETKVEEDEEKGLVVDDTSEFIRNISSRPVITKRENGSATPVPQANGKGKGREVRVKSEPVEDGVPLDEILVKREDDEPEEGEAYEDYSNVMAIDREGSVDVKPEVKKSESEEPVGGFGSTADEKLVSGGLASTLSILRQSGMIKKQTAEEIEREKAWKEKQRFIQQTRMIEMERELERMKSKAAGSSKDQAQRELENKQRQYEHAQKTLEAFKNYTPNVEITYHDEFGRSLTPKEAWKDLSHKFHGKGSGTAKREKLLKKVEEERKREAMSSGDTPLSTNAAFQARQERMGSATMVLGVGNKNTAPQADQFLGPSSRPGMPISKSTATSSSAGAKRKREPKVLG